VSNSWPAATVVLLRDGPAGMEVLLVRRGDASTDFGGMVVFPGGRVDETDWTGLDPDDELGAARVAAARETDEEAGLIIDPTALVPFSHWQPPLFVERRFLTWFFVGSAPDAVVAVDGDEIVDHLWLSPGEALARHGEGRLELAPPTWVTLAMVASHAGTADVLTSAAGREPPAFQSTIVGIEGGNAFVFAGDAALDVDPPDLDRPGRRHRLVAGPRPWRFHDTPS
jgi:8-oxo-dGTP pyrophosphatase MutT (NUDIX family)